jgi:hypothetical protein
MKNYSFQELKEKVNAMAATKTVVKDREGYFQPSTDKNGNGSAILRFLPAPPDEELPVVQLLIHAFQAPSTKWFVANCPTTLKQPCPVCESNTALWNGPHKDLASLRKRKMYYISNVLVVLDPKQPENNGKVLLFKYGQKIMGKIKDAITPPFVDTEPFDPFDPEAGANFRMRITSNGNFKDYDKSGFDAPSAIGDEDVIATVLGQRRSLSAIVAPSQFKSYDELKRKFDQIVGLPKAA